MKKIFAIGDIHGQISQFKKLLESWNPLTHQLVILGDLVDRGENPLEVIRLAKKLHEEHNAIVLMGNHEEMFLDWLQHPNAQAPFYYKHGGRNTIDSFFDAPITSMEAPGEIALRLKNQFRAEIDFLNSRPLYFEWHNFVFVHAGVDLSLPDWKDSTQEDFLWIRDDFHLAPNSSGKTFVFGHTPTNRLHGEPTYDVWLSSCGTKIGIDGGAVFKGCLHGLIIDVAEDTKMICSIDKSLQRKNTSFSQVEIA